jgi:hypothetical protein
LKLATQEADCEVESIEKIIDASTLDECKDLPDRYMWAGTKLPN